MAKQQQGDPLTGDALRQKIKTLGTLNKTQKAKACGYYTVTKGGGERVNLMQCLQALLEAEGMKLDGSAAERGRAGRSANYRLAVQANGHLSIGAAYTEQMALKPGDAFELVLGRKHIQLKQLDPVD